jgi:hypothetical protein
VQESKAMTPCAHSKWKAREARRAQIMHSIFVRIAKTGLTSRRMFRMARRQAGSGKFFRSYKRFEFLFLAWKKNPRPETVMRKWSGPSGPRTSSPKFVAAVEAFAVAARVTLRESQRQLGLPISYATIFRHCKIRSEISRLATIRRAQERLARREETLLEKITG